MAKNRWRNAKRFRTSDQSDSSNSLNNSLTDMYKRKNVDSSDASVKEKVARTDVKPPDNLNGNHAEPADAKKKNSQEFEGRPTPRTKKSRKPIQEQYSKTKFSDLGGIESILQEVCRFLIHMKHPEIYEQLNIQPPRGLLLHGPPGSGKTLLAHAIAGELEVPFVKIAGPEIVSGVSGESEEKIRELFDMSIACAPCVLFIDEIDSITPKRETAQKEMEKRIVAQLLTCLDDLNMKDNKVLVLGATNRPDSLDPALRRAGRFDREIALGIPDTDARCRILKTLCLNLKIDSDISFFSIAKSTPGFVGADLTSLVREAAMCAVNRAFKKLEKEKVDTSDIEIKPMLPPSEELAKEVERIMVWLKDDSPLTAEQLSSLCITSEDFNEALKFVQPSAKREGFATVPDVTWNQIGALKDIREELQLSILAPIRHCEKFESLGLTTPTGILLCGPPGCGKTLLAKAIANESGLNFISVKGPELLNMYVGESERAVRQCFQRARNSVPCVIFFDELDSLCPKRNDSPESSSSSRVVNQLLTEMDGLESRKQVFVIGATNRPDIIDPAMLRPGRLDKILYVGFPNSEDKIDILKTITVNGTKPPLHPEVKLEDIGNDSRCSGFTGADVTSLVREASLLAIKESLTNNSEENIKNSETENNSQVLLVCQRHFEAAFLKVHPSVSPKDRHYYDKMSMSVFPNLISSVKNNVDQNEKYNTN